MFIENAILLAYVTTIISETSIVLALQRPKEVSRWIIAILLINSFTHPFVSYLLQVQDASFVLVEFGVFTVEMLWYRAALNLSWRRSIIVSGLANVFSIFVGFVLRALFGL